MKEKEEQKRKISFFYLNRNSADSYKEEVTNYINEKEQDLNKIAGLDIVVVAHGFGKKKSKKTSIGGHLYVQEIMNNPEKITELSNYILSNKRRFIPKAVKTNNKQDYELIENIIKKEYGSNSGLKNYFWEFGKIIKHNKNK